MMKFHSLMFRIRLLAQLTFVSPGLVPEERQTTYQRIPTFKYCMFLEEILQVDLSDLDDLEHGFNRAAFC
jgi:hypothetical protein